MLPPEEDDDFWLQASESSHATIWGNPQDDVYAELLKRREDAFPNGP